MLHELWRSSGTVIHRRQASFIRLSEMKVVGPTNRQMDQLIETMYRAVLSFYRKTRGSGQAALDVSTFFNRQGKHKQFESWLRQEISVAHRIDKSAERFASALDQA